MTQIAAATAPQNAQKPKNYDRPAKLVAELYRLSRGEQAELRRSLGSESGARWLTGLLFRTGYGEQHQNSSAARLVAQLFSLKPSARDEDDLPSASELADRAQNADSLATQLAYLHLEQNRAGGRQATDRSSTEQRFLALLDSDREGLEYNLRQAVMLIQSQGYFVNWVRLLSDVSYWGEGIRRQWADDFYRHIYSVPNGETQTEEDTATA